MESRHTWRIVTWNIRGNHSPDPRSIAAALSRLAGDSPLDVVALQEVRRLQARAVARRLGMSHTWAFKHNGYTALLPFHAEGHAILTPHRLGSPHHERISDRVPRRSYRRRIALSADVTRGESTLRVVCTHLASHDEPTARLQQAARVRLLTERSRDETVIVGDFNDHLEPGVVDTIRGESHVDAWTVAGRRSSNGLTNPSTAPFQRLDHVVVPDGFDVTETRVPWPSDEWATLSDHLPVVVEVQIRSK